MQNRCRWFRVDVTLIQRFIYVCMCEALKYSRTHTHTQTSKPHTCTRRGLQPPWIRGAAATLNQSRCITHTTIMYVFRVDAAPSVSCIYSDASTLPRLLWCVYSDSSTLIHLLWFIYSDSSTLIHLLWFIYSDSSTLIHLFWYISSDSE